jgi:hypothetical protein
VCRDDDAARLGLPREAVDVGGCLAAEAPLALVAWRTRASINVLVSKEDCAIIADRITQLDAAARSAGPGPRGGGGGSGDDAAKLTAE